jgi:hypothetical protein
MYESVNDIGDYELYVFGVINVEFFGFYGQDAEGRGVPLFCAGLA